MRVSSHFRSPNLLPHLLLRATHALLLSISLKWTACSQAGMVFIFVRDGCIVIIMAQWIPSVPIPPKAFIKCWNLLWLSTSDQKQTKLLELLFEFWHCSYSMPGNKNEPCQSIQWQLSTSRQVFGNKLSLGHLCCSQTINSNHLWVIRKNRCFLGKKKQPSKLKSIPVSLYNVENASQ